MAKSKFLAIACTMAITLSSVESFAQLVPTPPTTATATAAHSATPWWIFVCPAGIVTAAMVKNWKRHKELNSPEAWSCGFLYWWNEAAGKYGRL
jgi:hypothetical protein